VAKYSVQLKTSAKKELDDLPKQVMTRVLSKLHQLADNPFPSGHKKLRGEKPATYRIRAGDYRVLYVVDTEEKAVFITAIGHRRDVYE
jgi:mRNA interferase RelE/StbE